MHEDIIVLSNDEDIILKNSNLNICMHTYI